jgi:hypothetical protein
MAGADRIVDAVGRARGGGDGGFGFLEAGEGTVPLVIPGESRDP